MFKNLLAARTIGMALKNLSSTETDRGIAYSATIYHDGKKVGMFCNRGDGGCAIVELPRELASDVIIKLKASGFENVYSGDGTNFDDAEDSIYLEYFFEDLYTDHEMIKNMKRHLKTKTLFTMKGAEPGRYREVNAPFTPELKAYLVNKYPDLDVIINEIAG
jgi:hypothetical protein